MDNKNSLAYNLGNKTVTTEDIKSNEILNQLAKEASMRKLISEDIPLEDSSMDLVPLAGPIGKVFNAVDKAAVTAAIKIPTYLYDKNTYKGLAEGLVGKKPIDVSDFETWAKLNPTKANPEVYSSTHRYMYDKLPNYEGYMDPSTLQYAAKNDISKVHELQHVEDYLKGKPSGSSVNAMKQVVEDMGRYNYTDEGLDKIAWRLYNGNLGERAANKAAVKEFINPDIAKIENVTPDTSIANLINRDYLNSIVEDTYNASKAGIANTITANGLATKRALLGYSPYYSKLRPGRSQGVSLAKALVADQIATQGWDLSKDSVNKLVDIISNSTVFNGGPSLESEQ